MARKPARTWAMVASLGVPLAIVGASAMAISYATLIDVARVNGLPLPELFPILIDVGTVATMIAAAQFRMRGVSGRWLAYTTFVLLSVVSIIANAAHAGRAADLTVTSPWIAAVLASVPPTALLAITHLVMMLIPDEKERARLAAARERAAAPHPPAKRDVAPTAPVPTTPLDRLPVPVPRPEPALHAAPVVLAQTTADSFEVAGPGLRLVEPVTREPGGVDRETVRQQVLEHMESAGRRPTGKLVGEWLGGKTPKTGQRFLTTMEQDGCFAPQLEAGYGQ